MGSRNTKVHFIAVVDPKNLNRGINTKASSTRRQRDKHKKKKKRERKREKEERRKESRVRKYYIMA